MGGLRGGGGGGGKKGPRGQKEKKEGENGVWEKEGRRIKMLLETMEPPPLGAREEERALLSHKPSF